MVDSCGIHDGSAILNLTPKGDNQQWLVSLNCYQQEEGASCV